MTFYYMLGSPLSFTVISNGHRPWPSQSRSCLEESGFYNQQVLNTDTVKKINAVLYKKHTTLIKKELSHQSDFTSECMHMLGCITQPPLDQVLLLKISCIISKLLTPHAYIETDFTDVIKEKGIENVTVEDLVAGVTPKGRGWLLFSIFYKLLVYQNQRSLSK